MRVLVDDERIPIQQSWGVVRNHNDFVVLMVLASRVVEVISFDNDLGLDSEDGYWCLRWLVDEANSDDPLPLPNLKEIIVHTANRQGGENMISYANNAVKHVDQFRDVKVTWYDTTNTTGHVKMPDDFDYSSRT